MLSKEQQDLLNVVYERFMESEGEGNTWAPIDDCLELVSWLKDYELIFECEKKFEFHCQSEFRCEINHDAQYCMAPLILEAVEVILDIYHDSGELLGIHRYCLEYYVSLSELKLIFNSK